MTRTRSSARRFGLVSAITALVTSGVLLGSALPAQAGWADCPQGSACIWAGWDYVSASKGSAYIGSATCQKNTGAVVYRGTNLSGANSASSVVNNGRTARAYFYDAANFVGYLFSLNPKGERDPNLSNGIDTSGDPFKTGASVNDRVESFRFDGFCK